MDKNNSFKLGRSIAQTVPFHRIAIKIKKEQQKEIITTKSGIIMVTIVIVKIAVLFLWI